MNEIRIDCTQKRLGTLASNIAKILEGKNTPQYAPEKDIQNRVILKNIESLDLPKKKFSRKSYRWHTGYPGGIREISLQKLWEKDPKKVVRLAVYGMLPKNSLRPKRMKRLIFE